MQEKKGKVAIIGANNFQNSLILKAKEMGYETHVFAWACGDIGEKTADYFYPISIVEKEQILEKCKEIKPNAVISVGSDLASITVNYVANKLGLPCNNPDIILQCTNKYEMRKAFLKEGVSVPKFVKVGAGEPLNLDGFKYPIIVKPTDRSGSRGIFLCQNEDEIKEAIIQAADFSFEKKSIVEEYIEGNEYSCECISQNGKHNFLAITKKYTSGAPHFIETGHIEPAGLTDEMKNKVIKEIFKALDALGIENSASHSEFKINKDGEIKIIEIGARMGGDCIGSDLVKISTGYDFLQMTLDVALGNEIKFEQKNKPKQAIIKFIFNKEDIQKLKIIEEKFSNTIYFKSTIDSLDHKIVDSSSRYGYFILECDEDERKKIDNELLNNGITSLF
jgi:biotin carboxylase